MLTTSTVPCLRSRAPLLAALALVAAALAAGPPRVHAQDTTASDSDWELLASYAGPARALQTLPSGDTLALGADQQLFRSTDDGDSWQPIADPPDGHAFQVDPVDPSTVYGSNTTGILKSTDGGAAWRVIFASSDGRDPLGSVEFGSAQFAVSPVDHQLLYFAHPRGTQLLFDRSRDGGATWERTWDFTVRALCSGYTRLLVADPTDARVVWTDLGCYAGRNRGTALRRSDDQGSTWHTVFPDGQDADVGHLAGGTALAAGRVYLTGDALFAVPRPARLFRSDDSGATWSLILEAESAREVRYGGLAVDPTAPDTVWVALAVTPDASQTGVRVSTDAGQTWAFLGRQDIGLVADLVRTADGRALLAATNEGIWRYLLPGPDAPVAGVRASH